MPQAISGLLPNVCPNDSFNKIDYLYTLHAQEHHLRIKKTLLMHFSIQQSGKHSFKRLMYEI